jgi:hypothetical protein
MAPTALTDFLRSLAAAIAAEAALELAGEPRSLWVHKAVEARSTAVYTTLRCYGGTEAGAFSGMRAAVALVQLETRGTDDPAVLAQAWKVHESLLDDEGRPRMHWAITGKRLNAGGTAIEDDPAGGWFVWVRQFINVPGILGRDDDDRAIATGNVEIEFERQA